jgi:glutaredoxin 3
MKVLMYTSQFCPYCVSAENLLKKRGVNSIEKIYIDTSIEEKDKMVQITGRRTVPQIFINNTHVGGFDDLKNLDQSGDLDKLLGN